MRILQAGSNERKSGESKLKPNQERVLVPEERESRLSQERGDSEVPKIITYYCLLS